MHRCNRRFAVTGADAEEAIVSSTARGACAPIMISFVISFPSLVLRVSRSSIHMRLFIHFVAHMHCSENMCHPLSFTFGISMIITMALILHCKFHHNSLWRNVAGYSLKMQITSYIVIMHIGRKFGHSSPFLFIYDYEIIYRFVPVPSIGQLLTFTIIIIASIAREFIKNPDKFKNSLKYVS